MNENSSKIFIFLSSFFAICLVISNVIFQKFIEINILDKRFFISAGDIVYPITFLIISIVSEIFGKKSSDFMVKNGIVVSLCVMALFYITDIAPVAYFSPLSKEEFSKVFGKYDIAFIASIVAAFISQLLDIRLFMFIKKLTKDKFLWLRNSVSTFFSQVIDTYIVLVILYWFNIIPLNEFSVIFGDQLLFKVVFSIMSIPIIYLAIYSINYKKPSKTAE